MPHAEEAAEAVGPVVATRGRVALESLRRLDDGALEARFVNYHHHAEPLRARMAGEWDRTDLTGAVLQKRIDPWSLPVPASSILTLRTPGKATAPNNIPKDAPTGKEDQ